MNRILLKKTSRPLVKSGRRLRTLLLAGAAGALLGGILLSGLLIAPEALAPDFSRKGMPPSLAYPFGTDWLGRNMLPRTLKGLSLSLWIGLIATFASTLIAVVVGAAAGTGKKWMDDGVNWWIDLVMSIPHLLLLILISFACGRGLTGLLVGIALTHWTSLARLVRAEVLQIRSQPYLTHSRRLGHSPRWIFSHHLLPCLLPQILMGGILLFPHAILHESALSFLGYGLPPEQPAIGIILSESMKYLTGGMWWVAVFPGLSLVALVLLFDTLGEQVKILLSPRHSQE